MEVTKVRENDAYKKRCPFSKEVGSNCHASSCMMWVWYELPSTAGESARGENRIGGCGLVHKE